MKYKTEYQIVICHNDMLTKLHNIRLELWRKSPLILRHVDNITQVI